MQRRQNLIEEKIKFYNRIEKISNLYNITPLYNFINNIPDAESVVLKP